MYLLITTLIFSIIIFSLCLFLFYRLLKKRKQKQIQQYSDLIPPRESYSFHQYSSTAQTDTKDWTDEMKMIRENFVTNSITHIYFVHGTFVGNDPFHIIKTLKILAPRINPSFFLKLENLIRNQQNNIIGDFGNFDHNYISKIRVLFGEKIQIYDYNWSGANHHLARLEGTANLLQNIYDKINFSKPNRLLLIGHSHAGQLFALLSQLILSSDNQNQLLNIIVETFNIHPAHLKSMINKLKKQKIDMVTMGTPPRYQFFTNKSLKLLHLINHRGDTPFAGDLSKLLFTRDGDYIQQLGISGSDSPSPLKRDRQINKQLDQILGTGSHLSTWKQNIKYKKRVHEAGMNYLIDYGDNSSRPNCLKTLFGHGVYTSQSNMLYNLKLIKKYFYS